MGDKVYCITIHYLDKEAKITDIDEDRYGIIDLRDDVKEKLGLGDELVVMRCSIDGTNERMEVNSDKEVMEMFVRNQNVNNIDIFIEVAGVSEVDGNENEAEDGVEGFDFEDVLFDDSDEGSEDGIGYEGFEEGSKEDSKEGEGDKSEGQNEGTNSDSDDSLYRAGSSDGDDDSVELCCEDELENYASDDHCETFNDSDDELPNDPLKGALTRNPAQFPTPPGERHTLGLGMIFHNMKEFRDRVKDFIIQEGFKVVRSKNQKDRMTIKCAADGCPWRIHASALIDEITIQVKTYNSLHTCIRTNATKEASVKWIASKLVHILRNTKELKPREINNVLKQKYRVDPPYMQIYRAKKIALNMIHGGHAESYGKLPYYSKIVCEKNEGSMVVIESELEQEGDSISSTPTFKRFFLGLGALRDGYLEGCSPFLGFDGCHLKGPYGGVLLAAIGLDGNNGLYPLAFAVVEIEDKDTWQFFFDHLSNMVGGFTGRPWTFMSDRQKGLVEALNDIAPDVIQRRCARHIYANFRQQHHGHALKKYFWMASRAYNASTFNFAMYKIKELKRPAYDWLVKFPSSHWSRHAFDTRLKNDHVTNNISESFNAWISKLRDKPVLTLLDGLRSKCMSRLQKRKIKGMKWTNSIMKNAVLELNISSEGSNKCRLLLGTDDEFEVRDSTTNYIVNLNTRSCDCRVWDVSGIPCKHAVLAIRFRRERVESYTDSRFSRENYIKTYRHAIHPVTDPKHWPEDMDVMPKDLHPPLVRRQAGRPRQNRAKEPGEGGVFRRASVVRCGICRGVGHNRSTCPKRLQPEGEVPPANATNLGENEDSVPLAATRNLKRKAIDPPASSQTRSTGRGRGRGRASTSQPIPPSSLSHPAAVRGKGKNRASSSQHVPTNAPNPPASSSQVSVRGRGRGRGSSKTVAAQQVDSMGKAKHVSCEAQGCSRAASSQARVGSKAASIQAQVGSKGKAKAASSSKNAPAPKVVSTQTATAPKVASTQHAVAPPVTTQRRDIVKEIRSKKLHDSPATTGRHPVT